MADETEGELQSSADIAAARQAFLSEPPEIVSNEPAEPVVDEAAEEAAALDELTQPPAAPEGGTTPPPPAPAPTGTPDPYAEFGGREAVEQAVNVQAALRTEQGVRMAVANGLVTLGYSVEQVRAALEGAEVAPAAPAVVDPLEGLDDEDVLTVSSAKALIEQAVTRATAVATEKADAGIAPIAEAIATQQRQQVQSNTDAALISVFGPVPDDPTQAAAYRTSVDAIVQRAGASYDPSQWANPHHITSVIQQAHAEIEAESEARFKAYLLNKKQVRDSQPVHTGGGAGGEGPLPEPKNLAEAREQARAGGFFQ